MKKSVQIINCLLICWASLLSAQEVPTKLYWFIPDGVRAEPDLFNLFAWAKQGYLPNIRYMMDHGVSGYSKPVFPTHTPVNFAALLTGTTPKVNGVADGPMHSEGFPLEKVSVAGFRSTARKVPAIWSIMEKAGKKSAILCVPGSTPPEINNGAVIRGRWGGWGAETYSLVFEKKTDNKRQFLQGRSTRLFFNGPKLVSYIGTTKPDGWIASQKSYSPASEITLTAYGLTIHGYIYDSKNDGRENYDHIIFSIDKSHVAADLKEGEWGPWTSCTVFFDSRPLQSYFRLRVIKLDNDGYFRIRILFNGLNSTLTMPEEAASEMTQDIGPLVDYPDNYPPQLIFYNQDKSVFQDEMQMSFNWHRKAIGYVLSKYSPDIVIHDIYSPNEMLTSRWWMGYVDPASTRYNSIDNTEREKLWAEVKGMYLQIDSMIGEILAHTDSNTLIVFSSDHGAYPLNTSVMINNLLAKNGFLTFHLDSITGEPVIDWARSKAVYLKMDAIYINPDGLAGNWKRGSGKAYEQLREEIEKLLMDLTDDKGVHPVSSVTKWEDAEQFLDLPKERVGDLIISNKPGFGFYEEFTEDLELFSTPLISGYKQSILADTVKAMWTPFIIMGKGVKQGVTLSKPISHIEQLPTILKLMQIPVPSYVEGKAVEEVFQ
jgi:predicted AlkP superfamily phosphohydrolase/phosphomutase